MPAALAIAAHPDDIEFCMAGTLLRLAGCGWDIHYCNLSAGNLGSATIPGPRLAAMRRKESQAAARKLGATWHSPIARDLEIFYNDDLLRRVAAVVRKVRPTLVLTHSPQDYMEDHTETCRLAVSAAFARGAPNFVTRPRRPAWGGDTTVYHAMPHGLCDGMRRRIVAGSYVDVSSVQATKLAALACHESQHGWLQASQGMNSYLSDMERMAREVGRRSRRFRLAEGWRRHSAQGFCAPDADPLRDALGKKYLVSRAYERGLERG